MSVIFIFILSLNLYILIIIIVFCVFVFVFFLSPITFYIKKKSRIVLCRLILLSAPEVRLRRHLRSAIKLSSNNTPTSEPCIKNPIAREKHKIKVFFRNTKNVFFSFIFLNFCFVLGRHLSLEGERERERKLY